MKKSKHLYALQLARQIIADIPPSHSLNEFRTKEKELQYLKTFLERRLVVHSLGLLDILTHGPNLDPLVNSLRPTLPEECDSLQALSDLWSDLEQFVMQTREEDEPVAHELYDLLADPHLRGLLVAYDDVSNRRYVAEDFDLVPIYFESVSLHTHPIRDKNVPQPETLGSSEHGFLPDDSLVEVTAISQDSDVYVPGSPPESSALRMRNVSPRLYAPQQHASIADEPIRHPSPDQSVKPRRSTSNGYVSSLVDRFEKEQADLSVTPLQTARLRSSRTKNRLHSNGISPRPLSREYSHFDSVTLNSLSSASIKKDKRQTNHPTDSAAVLSPVPHPHHSGDARSPSGSARSPGSHPIVSQAKSFCSSPSTESAVAIDRDSSSRHLQQNSRHSVKTVLSDPAPYSAYQSDSLPHRKKKDSALNKNDKVYSPGAVKSDSLPRRSSHSSSHRMTDVSAKPPPKLPKPGEVRRVRLRRDRPGEEVGITITLRTPSPPPIGKSPDNSAVLTIQRVMVGSLADRNGAIFPGDILLEFNGCPVRSKDQVLELMRQASGALEFDLLVKAPSSSGTFLKPGLQHKQTPIHLKRFIRTFFDYDAHKDALMPTGDVGLSFKAGEVLELIDDQDPNWWQARPLNDPRGKTRLIPSQTLEERRKAFNQQKAPNSSLLKAKRKIKTFFRAADSSALRLRADLWSYEEVVPWPQTIIPCLLLLGVTGVGRRNLKVLLANAEPNRFAYPISDTTNPAASTNHFRILSKSEVEADVRSGAYVEWGKVDGHFYGIRFAAIRKIIASGRTAVLDCEPQTVHLLHQPEFNPCTVFIAPPTFDVAKRMMEEGIHAGVTKSTRSDAEINEMIEASKRYAVQYRHLYFHTLINSDMHHSVDKLCRLVSRLERQPSWIPSGWAYELSVPTVAGTSTTFVPGSSSLSSLGIHGLPPSRPSTITRSVLSGLSEASSESAHRLSRPPSIGSGVSEGLRPKRHKNVSHNTPRLYERHRKPSHEFRPLSPVIPEQDTPSESGLGHPITGAVTAPTSEASAHARAKSHRNPFRPRDRPVVSPVRKRSPSRKLHETDHPSRKTDDIRETRSVSPHSNHRHITSKNSELPVIITGDSADDAISDTSTEPDSQSDGV